MSGPIEKTNAFLRAGAEERLLARLASAALSRTTPAEASDREEIDWRRFVALACRHHVVSLLSARVSLQEIEGLPDAVVNEIRYLHQLKSFRKLALASNLVLVVSELQKAGVPALCLKGVAFACEYYGDMSARDVGDIDLLISPQDVRVADSTIKSLGFSRISNATRDRLRDDDNEDPYLYYHYMYRGAHNLGLELHFRLHPNSALLPVDVASIVANGPKVELGGGALSILPPALNFLHLALHGARHEWERLQWVCDIGILCRRTELVADVIREARRLRLLNPVAQALLVAHRSLDAWVPPEAARLYSRSPCIRYLVHRAENVLAGDHPYDARGPVSLQSRIARRFYQTCLTRRMDFHWHEAKRSAKRRVAASRAVLPE